MAGGRPLHGAEAKRAPLSLRTSPELRNKVEKAAERSTRSLAQEIEHRLEMSFASDESFGGEHNHRLVRMIHGALLQVEARTGKTWMDDVATFHGVKTAIEAILQSNRPKKREDSPLAKAAASHSAAATAVQKAREKLYKARGWSAPPAAGQPGSYIAALLDGPPSDPKAAEKLAPHWQALDAALTEERSAMSELMEHLEPAADAQRTAMTIGDEVGSKLLHDYGIQRR